MSKIADETLFKLIHDFLLIYLPTQRNSSPNTIRAYKTSLEMLLDFIKEYNQTSLSKVTFRMLDRKAVSAFLTYLEAEKRCCISTRNHRLKCIKAFLKYAAMVEPSAVIYQAELSKIPLKKEIASPSVEYMSENAVSILLKEPDTSQKLGIRNQFFMILAYDTGARVQELVDLRLRDIRLGKTPTAVLSGKGGKVRSVPLMKATVQHLSRYLSVFHHQENMLSDRPLFYTIRQGAVQPLSCDGIRKWMKQYGLSAKEKCNEIPDNVHPHLFRHSRAMHLYQNGMDLTLVSQWLGHANLETTLIYAHADTEQKRMAIEKATPKSSPANNEQLARYNVDDDEVLKRLYGLKYDMELQRKESKEFLDDLTTRDQRMMFAVMTLAITADTKEQLDSDTEAVLSVARKHMCQLAVLKFQQLDGLNTALPIGVRKINAFRTLTTESLAVFIPFKVQEIQDKGGIYFGENAISHNLILCNKANLLNQSAFLLGVPGAGKSFSAKELIAFLMLHPDYSNDDILICDPEGEFGALVKALGREKATVAHLVAGGKDRLNAMYMVEGYGEQNPIVEKSQFVMSLIEQIDKRGVGPQHKSIIDRCTALVYPEAEKSGRVATLCDLRNKLLEQPEDKAREIALSLELYTTGSLDIFGRESTVDLNKPYVVFDIHGLGEQLKPAGSLVITDTILNRVTLNWKRGKRTHVFIDEFHVMFENEQSGIFFNSAWRQFRKRGAYPTAITQNVEYLLDSVQASTMLSNSEFIVMLNQAASDRAKLAKLLNISNEQMSYVTNADAGCGLIRYGSALVPFINRFPRDTKLYALMTTKPGEGVFGGEEVLV